jgi:hypothetical protein
MVPVHATASGAMTETDTNTDAKQEPKLRVEERRIELQDETTRASVGRYPSIQMNAWLSKPCSRDRDYGPLFSVEVIMLDYWIKRRVMNSTSLNETAP